MPAATNFQNLLKLPTLTSGMDSSRVVSFSKSLDSKKNYHLFVRFIYSEDFSSVDEFSVSLIYLELEKHLEIIRYDCSRDEAVHVHYFHNSPPKKIYLNDSVSLETLWRYVDEVENNWENYAEKYFKSKHFGKR